MHVHVLRETHLSNHVKLSNSYANVLMDKKSLISHKIFLSQRYAVQFFPYLIGKRHLVWFTTKKACNDAKQLDEQNITIYGANYLIETGSLEDRQHSG